MILRGTIAAIEASGVVPAPPVFTTAPSITGTENVGQDLTLSLGAVDNGTITGTLKRGATVLVASVTDGQTYTLVDADEGTVLTLEAEATNADGTTTASDTTGTITYAAPSAAGALADQVVQVSTGSQTVDASGDFTVTGDADLSSVTWSLPTTPSGVTIDSDGIITIDTGATGLLDASTVTVRATNSGGSADSGFSLTVADVPDAFADGEWSVDGAGDVDITSLPADNNDPLTDIEYRINGGTAQSFGASTTGTYATGASAGDNVEIRAVNSIGAGAWSSVKAVPLGFPQTLFTADEPGFVVDISDISSLWQDDSASTAVASDGDPVALVQDTSGSANGVDHSTSVSGDRPTYKDDGTYEWIEFDGVDDVLSSVSNLDLTGTKSATAVFAIKSENTSPSSPNAYHYLSNNWSSIAPANGSTHVRNQVNIDNLVRASATNAAYAPPANLVVTTTVDFDADEAVLRVNGSVIATGTGLGSVTDLGSVTSELSRRVRPFLGRIYGGIVIGRALTTTETDDAEQWAADRNGVTL